MIFVKKNIFALIIFAALVALLFFYSQSNRLFLSDNKEIKVIATLFPFYDFARIVGGDKAEVALLLPPGAEAHSFEPKPSDIIKISKADIFIYTGDFMEPWVEDILKGIDNKNLILVNASGNLDLIKEDEKHEGGDNRDHGWPGVDPHVWLDFSNDQKIADSIYEAYVKKDPSNSSYYGVNAVKIKSELASLDMDFQNGLSSCKTDTFIHGGHYAFGYLAKRYNLNYLAAQGFAPDSEPTAKGLVELMEQLKEKEINYIFYEELASPKIAEIISRETGAKMLLLNGVHNITKKDLESGISFISIMKKNLLNLKTGMQCQ